jgi:hypothetical protein
MSRALATVRKVKIMEPSSEDKYLLWERQHQADKARTRRDLRDWMKNFALVFSLVAVTVAISTLLAR